MRRILISAGDASGDLHGAGLARGLFARMPDLHISGLGGERMRRAGVEILVDQSELAIGGLVELAGNVGRILRVWNRMTSTLRKNSFDLVILVDSGGFNLPFARYVRRRRPVPMLYYVAPQVWAWRSGRKRKLAARVDRLAVIHPFEVDVWADSGLRAEFVGHPLVDELRGYVETTSCEQAQLQMGLDKGDPWVALLPGSRRNEIRYHLPIQLATAGELHARGVASSFVLVSAPSIERSQIDSILGDFRQPNSLHIEVVDGGSRDALRAARVAIAKPGTVTLEAMLLGTPMVVMGRANPLTATILKRSLKIPYLAMPNLIAGRSIVPELLQERAQPAALADAVEALLQGAQRGAQLEAFELVRASLGANAIVNTVRIVEEMLDGAAA